MKKKERFYYRLYFLKPTTSSDGGINWEEPLIFETNDNWNIVCKEFPYDILGEAKDLPKVDWVDYDGVEVYLPKEGGLPLKAQNVELEFVCCSDDARADVVKFRDFITGRDKSGVRLGVYDSYTGLSGIDIIYQKFKPDIYWRREGTKEIVTFKVEFLFTKPMEMNRVIHPKNGHFNDDFNDDLLKEYIFNLI